MLLMEYAILKSFGIYPTAEVSSNLLDPFYFCNFLGLAGEPKFHIKVNFNTIDQVTIYYPLASNQPSWEKHTKLRFDVFAADWV